MLFVLLLLMFVVYFVVVTLGKDCFALNLFSVLGFIMLASGFLTLHNLELGAPIFAFFSGASAVSVIWISEEMFCK